MFKSAIFRHVLLIGTFLCLVSNTPAHEKRIVSVGGSITEIVYALGADSLLVGIDTSSNYPKATNDLPKVGYQRRLSTEGVLSLTPSVVLASADAGPPEALQQLKDAGVRVVVTPESYSVEGAIAKIRAVANELGRAPKGESLISNLKKDVEQVENLKASITQKTRVLFIYARGQGTLMVAGTNTSANAIIGLSGGVNAVTAYEGYKPLTAEAAIAAAPDVILMLDSGLESLGDIEGLLKAPGIALTPAGKQRRILTMDGLFLLGFGPRTGQAAQDLANKLYPQQMSKEGS